MCKVSVIMAAYNSEKYIKDAICSILNQSYTDFELIVVWDRQSEFDKTGLIVGQIKDSRIILVENECKQGLYHARNIGLETAAGEYILNFDADDIAKPELLETLVLELESSEGDCVCAGFEMIDAKGDALLDKGVSTVYRNPGVIVSMLFWNNVIANGAALFRKSIVDKNGLKYRKCKHAEDYMFWIDFLKYGKIKGVEKSVYYYRIHDDSGMNTINNEIRREEIRLIHKYIIDVWNVNFSKDLEEFYLSTCGEDFEFLSLVEIERFIELQKEMISIMYKNGFPYPNEFKIACRLRMAERIRNTTFLWEQ